jgi:hypothetical protein
VYFPPVSDPSHLNALTSDKTTCLRFNDAEGRGPESVRRRRGVPSASRGKLGGGEEQGRSSSAAFHQPRDLGEVRKGPGRVVGVKIDESVAIQGETCLQFSERREKIAGRVSQTPPRGTLATRRSGPLL